MPTRVSFQSETIVTRAEILIRIVHFVDTLIFDETNGVVVRMVDRSFSSLTSDNVNQLGN